MPQKVRVAPSILASDFSRLGDELRAVELAGADWVHLDIMDGAFVPNLTFGPPVVAALRAHSKLPFDCHLMIESPDQYLDDFARAGADIITVHVEACRHLERTLSAIRALGKKAGVALNPHTPENVLEYLLHTLDLVLVMSVNPGFGNQRFIESAAEKLRRIRSLLDRAGRTDVVLEVDGGITAETAPRVIEAGATMLVAGTAVFSKPDYAAAIRGLRSAAP